MKTHMHQGSRKTKLQRWLSNYTVEKKKRQKHSLLPSYLFFVLNGISVIYTNPNNSQN